MQEVQREFDKHRISVPVEAHSTELTRPPVAGHIIYNGPVVNVHGDRAQLAWNNETVNQSEEQAEEIAPGYEALAQALVSTLRELPGAGLDADDRKTSEGAARQVLAEVTRSNPDRGAVKRGVAIIKGLLAPIALGTAAGARQGVQEWARTAIDQLSTSL